MSLFDNKIFQIAVAVLIPFIGAWIVGYGSQRNMHPWYDIIRRPSWGPPDWLFPPVWSYLYASMGYASYRVWQNDAGLDAARVALILYTVQLLLNWAWPQV